MLTIDLVALKENWRTLSARAGTAECGAAVKGNALFPLAFYWKNGKVKVLLAVGKGKQEFDKRDDIKRKDSDREVKRATMKFSKGK